MSTVKGSKDVAAQLQANIDALKLKPNERLTGGAPTVVEYRLQLPKDPTARAMIEQATTSALLLATTVSANNDSGSKFVGGALRQIFDGVPKDGFAYDILLQIAAVPVLIDSASGRPQRGATLVGAFMHSKVEP